MASSGPLQTIQHPADATKNSDKSCSFLTLPTEVREIIYSYLFVGAELEINSWAGKPEAIISWYNIEGSIIFVNKALYAEARPHFASSVGLCWMADSTFKPANLPLPVQTFYLPRIRYALVMGNEFQPTIELTDLPSLDRLELYFSGLELVLEVVPQSAPSPELEALLTGERQKDLVGRCLDNSTQGSGKTLLPQAMLRKKTKPRFTTSLTCEIWFNTMNYDDYSSKASIDIVFDIFTEEIIRRKAWTNMPHSSVCFRLKTAADLREWLTVRNLQPRNY